MKKLILIIFLFLAGQLAYAQRIWGSAESLFAKNKYYANIGIGWASQKGGGNIVSIVPEVGRILNKHASVGLSGRIMFYGTANPGTLLNFHPYFRLQTSFPYAIPNIFVDIGFDFRRRAFDGGNIANYYMDFGIRPGLNIRVSDFVSIFLRGSFSGYQWSRENGAETARWKLFRFDDFDHCVGVSFFF